jgi:hypothetical protein
MLQFIPRAFPSGYNFCDLIFFAVTKPSAGLVHLFEVTDSLCHCRIFLLFTSLLYWQPVSSGKLGCPGCFLPVQDTWLQTLLPTCHKEGPCWLLECMCGKQTNSPVNDSQSHVQKSTRQKKSGLEVTKAKCEKMEKGEWSEWTRGSGKLPQRGVYRSARSSQTLSVPGPGKHWC